MDTPLSLSKYSLGVGDRFSRESRAQLRARVMAAAKGVEITPVWNKSNREHNIIGSSPASARAAADEAARALGWSKPYYVDADHIAIRAVDKFIDACDFYTIDVAPTVLRARNFYGFTHVGGRRSHRRWPSSVSAQHN